MVKLMEDDFEFAPGVEIEDHGTAAFQRIDIEFFAGGMDVHRFGRTNVAVCGFLDGTVVILLAVDEADAERITFPAFAYFGVDKGRECRVGARGC